MVKRKRTKLWFFPYGPSNSVANLCEALPAKAIRRVRSRYARRYGDVVVNWGCSQTPIPVDLNPAGNVAVATSKLRTFATLQRYAVPTCEWTQSKEEAQGWLQACKVLGRDLDNGKGGRGITVYKKGEPLGDHKFYVKYFRKQREFRIHVFRGKIIFEQEKLKKEGAKEDAGYSKYIRSHDRGWCFAFHHLRDEPVPEVVRECARRGVAALGLDFGAVDCGWNDRDGAIAFEVNTAPGIEESTLNAYCEAFRAL